MFMQVSRKETNIKDATNSKIILVKVYENLPCLRFALCVRWSNESLGLSFVL